MTEAKDIMTRNVISVKEDTLIYQAVEILVEHNISGIPVVGDDMALTGILTEKDVLSLFYGDEENENQTVADFMTPHAVFFEENEDLVNVCDYLLNNYFRRVPVVSEGKLVGIISRRDIIKHALHKRRKNLALHKR